MLQRYRSIQTWLHANKQPAYRFTQIIDSAFRQGIDTFIEMTPLPRRLRADLTAAFGPTLTVIKPLAVFDGQQATKTLFGLPDGHRVETVAMRYRRGWESFCISSQAGCGLDCSFCATGRVGLQRNLDAVEITDQVLHHLVGGHCIDSISLMGMGEALANPATFAALDAFTDPDLFALSARRLTVSTVGVVPMMRKLTLDYPQVNLTVSLHSPFEGQRSALMPINDRYPLDVVFATLDEHIRCTHRKVYLAYLLMQDVNDTDQHADGIAHWLSRRPDTRALYHVNLIRFNPASGVPADLRRPEEASVQRFTARLRRHDVRVTVRQSFGLQEQAACGQLVADYPPQKSV